MKISIKLCAFLMFATICINGQCLYKYLESEPSKTKTHLVPFVLKNSNNVIVPIFDSIENRYYSKMYSDLNEYALYNSYSNIETIRLTIMPSFSKSILINIKSDAISDSLIVEVKIFEFNGKSILMSPESIALYEKENGIKLPTKTQYKLIRKKISKRYWTEIMNRVTRVNKLYGCKFKNNPMPDGTLILMEEHLKTGYFIVHEYYDGKQDGDYAMLIKYIFKITGLNK